ncbi:armadillo-type protein [Tribonema minus]|uniref:non-specific serine/threonine protein kinase n=1 Tax=Tribonema minus TaxID=303371 RepID=A0A835Z840_9STRA|nr:armadillo-type protein [Tribonema minus]
MLYTPAAAAAAFLLSRLVLLSPDFAAQFARSQGPQTLVSCSALDPGLIPAPVLSACLAAIGQLARGGGGDAERSLREARLGGALGELLVHQEAAVRARACNLLGNLCRHSDWFYEELGASAASPTRSSALLPRLVRACSDADPATQKFACFAVGNAAFHSRALYPLLAPAAPPLVAALSTTDPKTRANAAGALGNLVRNGGALCGALSRADAPLQLLLLATRPVGGSAQQAGGSSAAPQGGSTPQQIALFSLGTCCAYAACREALMGGVEGGREGLEAMLLKLEGGTRDGVVIKYAARLRGKLAAPALV